MQENREAALAAILKSEDGTLNVAKSEPGGASKWGVSVDLLTDYRKRRGLPPATIADVAALDDKGVQASAIYTEMLLGPLRFDGMPSGVDYRLADIATNAGLTGGIAFLELSLGIWPLSNATAVSDALMSAVFGADPAALIHALSAAWIAQKHMSPNWYPRSVNPLSISENGYGHGWSNRNIDATKMSLSLVGKYT